jgi:hypothetical protein
MSPRPPSGSGDGGPILYASCSVTDRTDPYEIIGVRRDASLAEIRISYRRSTQILAPERFANASETVRTEAARRLGALNSAMEAIEAERAAESGSALGSLAFGGPAVSPAAEPSMRSIAVADEPPLPAFPAEQAPAEANGVVDAPDLPAVTLPELPEPEEATAPVELEPLETEPETEGEPVTAEQPIVREQDTEAGLPPIVTPGEDTSDIPLADLEPAPAPPLDPAPAPAPAAPQRFERPSRPAKRERSLVPRILAAAAVLAALAAVGVYFLLSGGSSKPAGGQFQRAGAPVSFTYPSKLVARQPPSGGLLKPTFSTAVGVDAANYVVVATYRISADVQADGSAIGTGGSRLTADRFDQSVDRAAERIAAAQQLKAKSLAQPGKAGDLIARIYDYTRPDGSSARYAFAFRGHTEYSIACFWDPAHAQALSAACTQVMTSLQREVA